MSRLKASSNTSKTVYQGMVLNRTHRSEYDDNQLRDQARHNSRLDQEIKNVERARTVMAKSMEADKQLFIKSGAQNNIRVTKSKQSVTHARQQALASQAASTAAQHHRHLVSDSRVRRSSVSDTDTVDTATSASRSSKQGQGQPKVTPSSTTSDQRQQKDKNNNNNNNKSVNNITNTSTSSNKDGNNNNRHPNATSSRSKDPKALPTTDDGQPNLDSIYDDFLSVNLNDPATTKPGHALATPARQQLGTRSGMTTGMDRSGASDQTSAKSSHIAPEKRLTLSVEAGSSSKGCNQERTGQTAKLDNLAGRPRTKWDNLATPKHSSPHLTKRAQIEQEFARPTARNSPSSPATQQTRLVGTYTLTAGSSTPTPVATTTTTTTTASASTFGSSSTPRKKSAHLGRK